VTVRRAQRRGPVRRDGETKRDATRRHLLERALALFQDKGVDATTMRDIAAAAGLSLGAAYYYFPSKEALIFAFYDDNQAAAEAAAAGATGTVRERLGALIHDKLASIAPHRAMLRSIIQHLVDPGDPLSAFSAQTRAVRERALAMFVAALDGSGLPDDARTLAANTLWLLQLACMLVFVNDPTADGARTHRLVDDGLDLIVPLLPLLATPPGQLISARVIGMLDRAGIQLG
jgi:AcrR family transcriptional regulator